MSFEELLLNYWASHASLYDIVPYSSVFAGAEADADMPFVKVFQDESKASWPTTGPFPPAVFTCRLELHHCCYDAATELLEQLICGLNGVRIPMEAGGMLIFRYTSRHHKRQGEMHWTLTAVFRCMVG
ncbi:MAG: hypothetical protein FWC43_05520 [Planctomycetaceae bacterium]|nr:hypothetical protein [Planctomycetaceae bacterium]